MTMPGHHQVPDELVYREPSPEYRRLVQLRDDRIKTFLEGQKYDKDDMSVKLLICAEDAPEGQSRESLSIVPVFLAWCGSDPGYIADVRREFPTFIIPREFDAVTLMELSDRDRATPD